MPSRPRIFITPDSGAFAVGAGAAAGALGATVMAGAGDLTGLSAPPATILTRVRCEPKQSSTCSWEETRANALSLFARISIGYLPSARPVVLTARKKFAVDFDLTASSLC